MQAWNFMVSCLVVRMFATSLTSIRHNSVTSCYKKSILKRERKGSPARLPMIFNMLLYNMALQDCGAYRSKMWQICKVNGQSAESPHIRPCNFWQVGAITSTCPIKKSFCVLILGTKRNAMVTLQLFFFGYHSFRKHPTRPVTWDH